MAFPLRQSPVAGLRRLTNYWTILFACSTTPGLHILSCIWIPQENGIFDAIEKQYLRSFIFAIYLVRVMKTLLLWVANTNFSRTQKIRTSKSHGSCVIFLCLLTKWISIIEAYTFNFEVRFLSFLLGLSLTALSQYRRIAGTDVVVPIMSLGKDLEKLTLGDGDHSKDPVLLASVEGRLPTFKDVKRSLKARNNQF